MRSRDYSEDTYTEALAVALQHPAVAADQQVICRLLQVCKAWRTAVQQSDACLTDITILRRLPYSIEAMITAAVTTVTAKLVQFSRWLPLHVGIVRSIRIGISCPGHHLKLEKLNTLAQHVLLQRLQAASATESTISASASACSSNGPTTLVIGAVAPRPLRLQDFQCSNLLTSPLIVSALPAATLTSLEISVPATATVQWRKTLGSLSSLRSLTLQSRDSLDLYSSSIRKLTKLTEVSLPYLVDVDIVRWLPQQICKLHFEYDGKGHVHADLSHFPQLRQVHAIFLRYKSIDLTLPNQLRELRVYYDEEFGAPTSSNIMSLEQLQHLTLEGSVLAPEDLLLLNQLQQLKSLDLRHYLTIGSILLSAAPIWPQLHALVAFQMHHSGTAIEIAAAMEAVAVLTRLTRLEVYFELWEMDEVTDVDAEEAAFDEISGICKYVKDLTCLKYFKISMDMTTDGHGDDMLHLSNLTGLTSLDVQLGCYLDSSMAIAVFLELTRLRALRVELLTDIYALPVIGKLQGLTSPEITDLPQDVQRSGLKFLTQLRNLRELKGFDLCNKEDLDQFWARVHD